MTASEPCKLCGEVAVLRESHVVPRFVNKWLKDSSLGHIRSTESPNQRIQDGPTESWLCDACEQRLSDVEKPFAEQVFGYLHATTDHRPQVSYGEWALRFATSISLRTLWFYQKHELEHLSKGDLEALGRAERVWREFLLGKREHPGEFEQHVIFVDALSEATGSISPFLNRYFLRTVHSDIVASPSTCVTYTKLCRIIVVGFVRLKKPREWVGTKLHVRCGRIGGDCSLPHWLIGYWNQQADHAAEALASMSERQVAKVAKVFERNIDEIQQNEVFRAVKADVQFSGRRAFAVTRRKDPEAK